MCRFQAVGRDGNVLGFSGSAFGEEAWSISISNSNSADHVFDIHVRLFCEASRASCVPRGLRTNNAWR